MIPSKEVLKCSSSVPGRCRIALMTYGSKTHNAITPLALGWAEIKAQASMLQTTCLDTTGVGGYAIVRGGKALLFSWTPPSPAHFFFRNRHSDKAAEPRHGRLALVVNFYFSGSRFEAQMNEYRKYFGCHCIIIYTSSASHHIPMGHDHLPQSCIILSCPSR